jgi:ribonuclease HI
MATKKKYYVVWSGIKPGVYDNWEDCKKQVVGVNASKYKSYPTQMEAENAFKAGFSGTATNTKSKKTIKGSAKILLPSISVDAACSGNPGLMEYRGVNNQDGSEIFKKGPYRDGTNNIGEFLAIVHALAFLKKQNYPDLPIYSDSVTAIGWVKKKKANTKLESTKHNAELFDLIERAEQWLKQNTVTNPIYKWETKLWGENTADFGRK